MVRPMVKGSVPWFAHDGAVHFQLNGELTSFEDPVFQDKLDRARRSCWAGIGRGRAGLAIP